MPERPKVKVCGLRRASDVELAQSLGADFFGTILYPGSPRFLDFPEAEELLAGVPRERRVAVMVQPDAHSLKKVSAHGFGIAQIHFDPDQANPGLWEDAAKRMTLWLAPRLRTGDPFPESLLPLASAFLLDAFDKDSFGGTGHRSDWSRFVELKRLYPEKIWILAGGLASGNVAAAVRETNPDAVDVNSGVEVLPGEKDPEKLRAFFQALAEG